MTTRLTKLDLATLLAEAKAFFLEHHSRERLLGMEHPLTEHELLLVAHYEAALLVLNQKGLLKDGAAAEARVEFEVEDVDPLDD